MEAAGQPRQVVVPDAAIEWIVTNGVVSNVELARLTNVDRRWRKAVKKAILEKATAASAEEEIRRGEDRRRRRPILLLPSMVRRLQELSEHRSITPSLWPTTRETFCAAWFAPVGIQEVKVSSFRSAGDDEKLDDCSSHKSSAVSEGFAPSGGQTYEGSDDSTDNRRSRHKKRTNKNGRSKSPASLNSFRRNNESGETTGDDGGVLCSYEWRGYRHPYDVLKHFGYAESFVKDILQEAVNLHSNRGSPSTLEDNLQRMALHQPTFAVRGATVARPESYCLCLDEGTASENNLEMKLKAAANEDSSEWVDIRLQEYKQSVMRRNRRRRELQRDVLPRVLQACPEDAAVHIGRRQRGLQFLNSSGSHAVCMTTPFFGCGPIPEPLTIFCVGIATEDGCFLSGLFRRFEIGHLYPNNEAAEATEQSAICIAAESWEEENLAATRSESVESLPYKFSSDDSSFESSRGGHTSTDIIKCNCVFKGVNDKLDLMYDDDNNHHGHDDDGENSEDNAGRNIRISRGRFGPGTWHCYTAIVDGQESEIRVDGISEPVAMDVKDAGNFRRAMLDGLTIGSDHCFGMSLCCGFGSGGGEGEGAISEIAVFAGRLDLADVKAIEQQLMEQHAIPPVETTSRRDEMWEEYRLVREGQALFATNPQGVKEIGVNGEGEGAVEPRGIPLRYMARHRLVAWHQRNPVTGLPLNLTKIGCRPGADSTDWE